MDPNKLNARLAPRGPWQAIDLGTRLYRQHWKRATLVWLLFTAVPFAALLGYGVFSGGLFWPLLLFWWLKPLWERPQLALFSRALFGEYPAPLALLRGVRGYALNGLGGQLSWRRFSPNRGFLNGIWQLEGSQGEAAAARARTLRHRPGQRAGTLMMVMVTLEQCLTAAVILLGLTLIPWQLNLEWSAWFDQQGVLHQALIAAAWYLVLGVLEPLYVATSFALYLNERTWLEGWDLQLGLARIGERRRRLSAVSLALLAVLLLPWSVEPARAAPPPDPKHDALELLASDTFMPLEIRDQRRLRGADESDASSWWERLLRKLMDGEPPADRGDAPLSMPNWLVQTLGALVLVALTALLVWIFWQRARGGVPLPTRRRRTPVQVAGLDTRAEALPEDPQGAARAALRAGDVRAALALLLRQTLVDLFQRHPLPLRPGATEQDCLSAYHRALGDSERVLHLEAVTQAWMLTAWAHRPASVERVNELIDQGQHLHGKPGGQP
ncbi:DUF4129 domain-containing protein [Alloalcanivorax mobilis]|uniref:DUF4129 domain-containing protein n=1 Tax=Alloalcanivorax mobilis TaxID=2019569 RepID=UPI000C790CE1|nr:DUF4129 domain-containing protein [Alloalcanivorax mobilis]